MEAHGAPPDSSTLPLVFKACSRLNAVEKGRRIHGAIQDTHLIRDVRVQTAVIDFYCKCGFVQEADQVFDEMRQRDLVSWNAMIAGYVGCGYFVEAIGLFRMMQKDGFQLNSRTLVQLLLACKGVSELRLGKEIHGYCLRNGCFDRDPHVGTALVVFYLNFDVEVSGLVFDLMEVRSSVSWNAMMTGYFDAGYPLMALELFVQMLMLGVQLDFVTTLAAVQACSEFGCLRLGMQIHQMATKLGNCSDLFILNALLNMYTELGSLHSASKIFDSTSIRDVALWNSMIAAHIEYGYREDAIDLFTRMRAETREDARTLVILFSSCRAAVDGLESGRSLHAHALKLGIRMDVAVGNALLSMYADLNRLEAAKQVFSDMEKVDVVSYNYLISALASNNYKDEAWELFGAMTMQQSEIMPNSYTMVALLSCCGDETYLNAGRSIHGLVIKRGIDIDPALNTALADTYMICGDEETARNLFEVCSCRDLISWNAMISAYVRKNQTDEALSLLSRMITELEPNSITIINILSACTDLANLPRGQQIHAYAARRFSPLEFDLSLANAFITMYARCGSLQGAENIFRTLQERNIISWNAMISGYATNGSSDDAIQALMDMLEEGFQPNGLTFLSVLSACRHGGLIRKGLQIFSFMVRDLKLTPQLAHYGCIVDLLVRGGFLQEAREFIDSMPAEPDASIWRSLLSGCRIHCDPEMAASVFRKLVDLEPMNPGNYVLLANIYAAAGLWSEVRNVRALLKEKGLKKPPGISWIILGGQVHSFAAGDTSHPNSVEIYANLNSLSGITSEFGCMSKHNSLFHDEEGY
ncbi:unnamed protein product [Linum trigynum]|uniref:Chlororespiratory reduction 21 n=1 Tax=Linum trigynum TaxID=586398 RepID=A0AAV2GHB1_9ROSI